ncbi:2794_t:CDS:2 [Acaulospora morrowiae]|uniref:2794_t:CDS:1 n=1 Tax=Acaulospora morrowiae TaxID=94023 RepID=A0A9N8ZIC0_9GLOM|nr:2794_t:CDS:2 [Acaulospora morrowiae]
MFTELYNNIYDFLTTAEERQINAMSVIYLGMKEDRWIPQNKLRSIIDRVVASASNVYMDTSSRQLRILRILPQMSAE